MCNALTEICRRGKFSVNMDRIMVARNVGEGVDHLLGDDGARLGLHANFEIFEVIFHVHGQFVSKG